VTSGTTKTAASALEHKKNKGKPLEVQYDEVQKCTNDMVQTVLMMNIQEVNLSPPQMHYLNLNEAAPR